MKEHVVGDSIIPPLPVCSDLPEFQVQGERFDDFIHCLSYSSCLAWPKQSPSAGRVVKHCGDPGGGDHFGRK